MSTAHHGSDDGAHPTGETTALLRIGEDLLEAARTADAGRAARTLVTAPGLRVTLIALLAGQELSPHEEPAAASLLCLRGEVVLSAVRGTATWRLSAHDLLGLPDGRHRLTAEDDALLLLTVRLD
ncbi:hypothetical protein [Streptomyces alkaliterrae]|uniref:Cupin n=1 Tax=Streptomyces alkaliterrae TaxID=2213162 RepID=A0A5P0YV90_9ACTN|nr:hypothetical protein [Streptomyces alkaliterrae]MBB1255601.1 hypothetical protein [Streptomyces alkaliterrae]MBB1261726.1 hypothetical protein [Streptomyces alkaliterrae]MQS03392.1 hypothetical protein [Streptomyces alkaliterrae]